MVLGCPVTGAAWVGGESPDLRLHCSRLSDSSFSPLHPRSPHPIALSPLDPLCAPSLCLTTKTGIFLCRRKKHSCLQPRLRRAAVNPILSLRNVISARLRQQASVLIKGTGGDGEGIRTPSPLPELLIRRCWEELAAVNILDVRHTIGATERPCSTR